MRKELSKRKAVLKQFEGGFNPRSPHHLAWLLYSHDGLGLPIVRDPKTRKPTTSQHAIEKLALRLKGQHRELVAKIKEVQHLEKARSTFLVLKREGRSIIDDQGYVHPAYKMTGTETGRLASGAGESEKSPALVNNALNIPDEWRVMYVPPPGMVFVAADWRALESRLTAYFSKDASYTSVLEEQLRGGPSVHAVVASLIYGVAPEDAKRTMVFFKGNKRPAYDAGKMCMHAWSYGMRPRAMVSHFGITLKEARHIDEVLSQRFQGVVRWRERLVQQVLGEEGRGGTRVLQNPFGWRRTFLGGPEQQNSVIAFLPQSTGASMWVRVAVALDEAGMHVVTGTYDSFLLAVPKDDEAVARAVQVLRSEMERSWPEMEGRTFPAEIAVGYNWGKASEDNPRGLTPV
jgi:DNA polymerase I-like protein with 3'-5' exonuclease and polymerase domains